MPTRKYTHYRPKNTFPPDVAEQSESNSQLRDATVHAANEAAATATKAKSTPARMRIELFRKKLAQAQVKHDELTKEAYDAFDNAIDDSGKIVSDAQHDEALQDTGHAIKRLSDMKSSVTYFNGEHLINNDTADILDKQIDATKEVEQKIHDKMKEADVENDEDVDIGKHYYANGEQKDLTDVDELADRLYKRETNQLNPNVVAALTGRFM